LPGRKLHDGETFAPHHNRAAVISRFLDVEFTFQERDVGGYLVTCR
jgi:hypothetical protein